ncbi:MAG: hypothetical protein HY959_08250 [Ignavibacteriae bacterium]|nr:hypothetical protein [Ignavibacteriota bacterium]
MENIHIHEDTSKPENRVNLTLFHLLMIDEVNGFIKKRLGIPSESLLYPSPNLSVEEFDVCGRPDFVINLNNQTIGYIEVELGREDIEQITRYRKIETAKVFSVVGKKDYNEGNLALDEIYNHLQMIKEKYENTQKYYSIRLFEKLIEYYIIQNNFKINSKSVNLSDKMRNSFIVDYFYKYFGEERILENEKAESGKVMFNTRGENGFSLRIYSRESKVDKSLSLMNRSGGRHEINFPSKIKLYKYLPYDKAGVDSYVNFIASLGAKDILVNGEKGFVHLPLNIVEKNIDKFCELISKLM